MLLNEVAIGAWMVLQRQNAFEQAKQFTLATEVTAMAITKLDGTAKGGVVIGHIRSIQDSREIYRIR